MNNLLQLEQEFNFDHFEHSDAWTFGTTILNIVEKENLKNVRIRVRYEGDLVFQYLMNGKNGERWLDLKENTVMKTGHSSLYVTVHKDEYPELVEDHFTNYAVCGGGFPLIVNGEVKGAFCVSGLADTEDHALIIEGLKAIKG